MVSLFQKGLFKARFSLLIRAVVFRRTNVSFKYFVKENWYFLQILIIVKKRLNMRMECSQNYRATGYSSEMHFDDLRHSGEGASERKRTTI